MTHGKILLAAMAIGLASVNAPAGAQDKPADCVKAGVPEMVEGQVARIDPGQGKLTLRANDGSMHEFQASKETLDDYKVGDAVKARLRLAKRCD